MDHNYFNISFVHVHYMYKIRWSSGTRNCCLNFAFIIFSCICIEVVEMLLFVSFALSVCNNLNTGWIFMEWDCFVKYVDTLQFWVRLHKNYRHMKSCMCFCRHLNLQYYQSEKCLNKTCGVKLKLVLHTFSTIWVSEIIKQKGFLLLCCLITRNLLHWYSICKGALKVGIPILKFRGNNNECARILTLYFYLIRCFLHFCYFSSLWKLQSKIIFGFVFLHKTEWMNVPNF